MDRTGAVITLSDDIISSFARSSIILDITSAQYYNLGSVYTSKLKSKQFQFDLENPSMQDNSSSNSFEEISAENSSHPVPHYEAAYAVLDVSQQKAEIDILCTAIDIAGELSLTI